MPYGLVGHPAVKDGLGLGDRDPALVGGSASFTFTWHCMSD